MDMHPFSAAANEPTTLPLPFPDFPVEIDELPDGSANEPPAGSEETTTRRLNAATQPLRQPRFDWEPGWRGQGARLEREQLFARLGTRWREERRRRYLEALLTSQPQHELPWRPYGDPVTRNNAG